MFFNTANLDSAATLAADFPPAPSARSLKERAIRGSVWTFGGYGIAQLLKLASTLVLTRMLFPEAFGLMAIVNTFIQGIEMFSEFGIGPSIIQSRRGDDRDFANTAWTIQIIRGTGLFIFTCLFAWPLARFYDSPELLSLIPAAGLTSLLSGFNATSLLTLNRNLALGLRTSFDLAMQIVNIGSTIFFALTFRSVWALVGGNIVEAGVRMIASHALLPGIGNRPCWEPNARRELFHFGKWIFIGTLLSFALQSDRLILGKLISPAELGLYGVALGLSQVVVRFMRTMAGRVLFPLYTRLREQAPDKLVERVFRIRALLMLLTLPPVCILVVWGPQIIRVLYDSRYHEAGWMLQILAAGAIASTVGLTISPVLLAAGDSFRHMLAMALQVAALVVCAGAGGYWATRLGHAAGAGVIVGITVSKFLTYPVNIVFAKRHGLWMPGLDAAAFGLCGAVIAIGWMLTR